MADIEHDWQRIAKVAMGLQDEDPVNWPHYADEAKRLVDENAHLRKSAANSDRDHWYAEAARLESQLAEAVEALREMQDEYVQRFGMGHGSDFVVQRVTAIVDALEGGSGAA